MSIFDKVLHNFRLGAVEIDQGIHVYSLDQYINCRLKKSRFLPSLSYQKKIIAC